MGVPYWVVIVAVLALALGVILTKSFSYWIVLPVVVGWLVGQYVTTPAVSDRSKRVVVLSTVWATAFPFVWPPAVILTVIALTAIGAYIVVHRDVTTPEQ